MSARADLSRIIPSFTVYKFMSTLVQPFTQFDAYKLGIIDSKGNFKNAKFLSKHILSLPLHPYMKLNEQDYIFKILKKLS